MGKSSMEKLKLLHILKMLNEETDETHRLSVSEIIDRLSDIGIASERKSVYRDLDTLEDFGYDILRDRTGVCLASRTFECAELRLLVDAVQASRFITEKKSGELIEKLSSLTGRHEAMSLRRNIYIADRPKADNESIYYTVDTVHGAMADNKMISFKYFDWTPEKKQELRRGGDDYTVSPWGLLWDDEKYYLIAYDSAADTIKHFRTDKMLGVAAIDKPREGSDRFARIDMGAYSKKVFGMYGGEECSVTLRCQNSLAGVIFDRFGTDVKIYPRDDGTFTAAVKVQISNNFFSWVMQFGNRMKITAPHDVCDQMARLINEIGGMYK